MIVCPTNAHSGDSSLLQHQSFRQSIKTSIQSVNAAVRLLLGLAILDNAITVKHYWLIVTSLREKLLQAGPHEIPHGDAYARVLLRLVERLVSYSNFQQNSGYVEEYGLCSCRRDYAQCLGKFLTEMAEGFVFMQQTGIEDDVYTRNKEPHADYLCYLASRLGGVPTIWKFVSVRRWRVTGSLELRGWGV